MGPGTSDSGDLDALIGDIRLEAARRRAAPDFPIEAEAALMADMDAQGPVGAGADLAAISAALRAPGGPAEAVALTAAALDALAARLGRLERLAAPLERVPVADPAGSGGEPDLTGIVGPVAGAGTVLVAGPGAALWVKLLAAAGTDAYGVDPAAGAYGDDGPVRAGPVLGHLGTVADGALAVAVVEGPPPAGTGAEIDRWAAELTRVAARVVVVSEAPWSWSARLGPEAADRSPVRPLSPETWMAALDRAGWSVTAAYGPDGRAYRVEGRPGRRA